MRPVLHSQIFEQLVCNTQLPECPTLDCIYRGRPEGDLNVSLVGESFFDWVDFLAKCEVTWLLLQKHEAQTLRDAAPEIHRQHRAAFGDRWEGTAEALLAELSLQQVYLNADGGVSLWYAGTAAFDHRDIDVELDSDLRVTKVKMDI